MPDPSKASNTTRQKVAILLASLGRDKAASVMRALSPGTVQAVTSEIRELGEILPEQREAVFEEFAGRLTVGLNPHGGEDVARALLQDVVGDAEAEEMIEEQKKQAFSSIVEVNAQDLANIISNEQPSVAAMILAFMPSGKSAEIIANLDRDMREEIITRLAGGRKADPEIVRRVEKIFVDKVVSVVHKTNDRTDDDLGGPQFVADMFQHVERAVEEEMLAAIQASSPEQADQIRDLMFTFEDLTKLSDPDIQKVLRQVPMDKLVIALRGVPGKIQSRITENLSKGARETLNEEMELLGRVKLAEVEAQQRQVVAIIRQLEAAGEIDLRSDAGDDVYV